MGEKSSQLALAGRLLAVQVDGGVVVMIMVFAAEFGKLGHRSEKVFILEQLVARREERIEVLLAE